MKYHVYILYSQLKDRFYIGYSHNPEERVVEHNLGATPSTRPGRPWVLAYIEEQENKTAAIVREREIKKKKSRKYLISLISSGSVGRASRS